MTSGGSTVAALERIREEGLEIAAVLAAVDRLAGGGETIEAAARAPPSAPWSRLTSSTRIGRTEAKLMEPDAIEIRVSAA